VIKPAVHQALEVDSRAIHPAFRGMIEHHVKDDTNSRPVKERGMGQVTYLSATHYTGILETVVDMPGGQTEQIKINYDSQRKGVCSN